MLQSKEKASLSSLRTVADLPDTGCQERAIRNRRVDQGQEREEHRLRHFRPQEGQCPHGGFVIALPIQTISSDLGIN